MIAPIVGSPDRPRPPLGFSLLEVIIATAILATSTVLLLSLFSTGQQHASRAEDRVRAQILCQTTLDELLSDPSQLRVIDREPIKGHLDWELSIDWTPTEVEGLIRIRVAVARAMDDLSAGNESVTSRREFALVRWTRLQPVADVGISLPSVASRASAIRARTGQ